MVLKDHELRFWDEMVRLLMELGHLPVRAAEEATALVKARRKAAD
jgi:hypothetical protein